MLRSLWVWIFVVSGQIYAMDMVSGLKEIIEKSPEIREKHHIYVEILKDSNIARAPWMPSLSIVGSHTFSSFDNATIEDLTTKSVAVNFTQNIFKGFADKNQYEIEQSRLVSAAARVLEERNQLSLEFIENYIGVLKNRDLLEISKLSRSFNRTMFQKIKKKVEVGSGRQLEQRHAQSTLDLAQLNYRVQQRNLAQELIKFTKLLERKVDAQTLEASKLDTCLPQSLDELNKAALLHHPTIKVAEHNIEVVEQEYDRAVQGYYPSLDLSANYYLSHDVTNTTQSNNYDVSLAFTFNLFNGLQDINKQEKQKARIHQKAYVLNRSKRDLKNRLELAWSSFQLNQDKYRYTQVNANSKRDTLKSYDYEFMLGRASLNAMLGATEDYYNALKDMTTAYYDLVQDYYRILEALGLIYDIVVGHKSAPFSCSSIRGFDYMLPLNEDIETKVTNALTSSYKCYNVKVDKLNIRKSKSVQSQKSGFLIRGTIFCSQEQEDLWIGIEKGWVHKDYVQEISILK